MDNKFEINQSKLSRDDWCFQEPEISKIRDKIESSGLKIKDSKGMNIYYGIKTGYNNAFIIDEKIKDELISEDYKNTELLSPLFVVETLKSGTLILIIIIYFL